MSRRSRRDHGPVTQPSFLPAGLGPDLVAIGEELDRIHESALWSAQGQFEQMKLWRSMNIILGAPAAVLAAIAGGTGLASAQHGTLTGIVGLSSAGFGAALTALNPSRRVSSAQAAATAYQSIQTDVRQLLTIRLASMSRGEAMDALAEVTSRREEVTRTADPPSSYAYWRSKRNITEQGGQSYGVDTASSTSAEYG